MSAGLGDIFGEFMRETLLQTAYLRFEVARLKGLDETEALARAVSFLDQNFEAIHAMLEAQDLPWETLERDIRERVKEIAARGDEPSSL